MRQAPRLFTGTFLAASLLASTVLADMLPPPRKPTGSATQNAPNTTAAPGKDGNVQSLTAAQRAAIQSQKTYSAFTLSINGIKNNRFMPNRFAYCQSNGKAGVTPGRNMSPGIQWTSPPAGTRSMALLMVDRDVPASFARANIPGQMLEINEPRQDFYHWVLVDIPPGPGGILEGFDSIGITEGGKPLGSRKYGLSGQNDYAMMYEGEHGGYDGPCPPWNDKRLHKYHFILYALDIPTLKLPQPIRGRQVEIIMREHILAQAEITGLFSTNPDWLAQFREKRKRHTLSKHSRK